MTLVYEEDIYIYKHKYRIITYLSTNSDDKYKYISYSPGMDKIIGHGRQIVDSVQDIRAKLLDYVYMNHKWISTTNKGINHTKGLDLHKATCPDQFWPLGPFTSDEETWMRMSISNDELAFEDKGVWGIDTKIYEVDKSGLVLIKKGLH